MFKLDPDGTETVLHTFTGGADGGFPFGVVLIRDSSGTMYGTASGGGSIAMPAIHGAMKSRAQCRVMLAPFGDALSLTQGGCLSHMYVKQCQPICI